MKGDQRAFRSRKNVNPVYVFMNQVNVMNVEVW